MIDAKIQGHKVVETPAPHIAPVIDIMEALKKSLESRKPPKTATASAGSSEEEAGEAVAEQPKRKRAPRKAKTA
jgi:non-homologous end joining protein Ku